MIRTLSLLAAAGLGLLALVGDHQAAAPFVADAQKMVYFGEKGPVLIELDVRIDGKPLRSVWRAFVDEVFDYADVDKDGKLSAKEAALIPPASTLTGGSGGLFAQIAARQPGGKAKMGGEAITTRDALARHYRETGLAPLQVSAGGRQTGFIVFNIDGRAPRQMSGEVMTNRIFALLDTNKDGKLSRKELEAAPRIFAKLDADDDEMITADELQGRGGSRNDSDLASVKLRLYESAMAGYGGPGPLHAVVEDDGGGKKVDMALAQRLLSRYGKAGEKGVSREQIGLSKEAFATLDADKDGKLDLGELARLGGALKADLAFTIRVGKRGEKEPAVEMQKAAGSPALRTRAKATAEEGMKN